MTTTSAGVGAMTAGHLRTSSLEASVGGGLGVADERGAVSAKVDAAIGVTGDGGAELHVIERLEGATFDARGGWQVAVVGGSSFGGYQSDDVLLGLSGGRRWNLFVDRSKDIVRTVALSFDAMFGTASHVGNGFVRDGVFAGLGVTLRRDTRYGFSLGDWKPVN